MLRWDVFHVWLAVGKRQGKVVAHHLITVFDANTIKLTDPIHRGPLIDRALSVGTLGDCWAQAAVVAGSTACCAVIEAAGFEWNVFVKPERRGCCQGSTAMIRC